MQGRVALITGAKGGLGTSITQTFLNANFVVAGVSRKILPTDFQNPNFYAFPADITQPQATRELVGQITSQWGRIDVLVHVAGGFAAAPVHETDDETWIRMRDLNLDAGFYVAREVIPAMRRQKSGRIIAIGSLAAVEPHAGLGAYMATKSALHSLYRTIALENQDAGITSNVILPGTMDTPANRAAMPGSDPAKWVQPSKVAELALMLANDSSGLINGALISME